MAGAESELQAIIDAIPIGVAVVSQADVVIREVNPRYCELLGYARDELIGRSVLMITHPDDITSSHEAAQYTRMHNATRKFVKRYIRKDGSVMWADVRITPFKDGHNIAAIDDITERRAAENMMRLQSSALQAAANAIAIARVDGIVEWVNDAHTKLTGFSVTELVGQPIVRTTPVWPTSPDLRATLRAGQVWQGEREGRRRDGSVFRVDQSVTPVHDAAGELTHFIAIKQDITERSRTQETLNRVHEALRASEERYRTLVDGLDDIVFSLDAAGRVTFISRAVATFGYTPEQCIGRPLTDFVHPDYREEALELNRRRMTGEISGAIEYRLIDSSGKLRTTRITTRRLPDGTGLSGIAVDVTAMRSTEDQLRAAQKMEAVGSLAGGIAHDFNNLLTVIVSYANMVIEQVHAEDPLRGDINEILTAATRATALTRQLLAFSRRQMLAPEVVDVHDLVEALGKMLERLIGEHVALVIEPAAGCYAHVDRGQLEQVVMNLVVNARDAMPEGGSVKIAVREVVIDEACARRLEITTGNFVRLSVADTGSGMDAATRARIFEPFFTTKPMGKGTGLGLATVYGIVKQSRGGIDVETVLGTGTTFSVYLPATSAISHAASQRIPKSAATGRERILVVEDEAPVRAVILRVLKKAGFDVLAASAPSEALELAIEFGPTIQLVVTDVVMPGMNGRELALRLREHCPHTRVLYMSGYPDDALEDTGVLSEEFLAKPFAPNALTERVRQLLDAP